MSSSTIFLVDDRPRVLESTAALLESYGFRVEAHLDPVAFLEGLDPDRSGVLLLDLRTPQVAGLELLERLRRRGSDLPVLFLSAHAEVDHVVQAMKGGARDFLLKPAPEEELVARLQDAALADLRAREERRTTRGVLGRISGLSRREKEVMDLVLLGRTNRDIGSVLGIKEKTAESHRGRVIKKLQVKNAVELTSKVLMAGYRPLSVNGSSPPGR